MLCWKHRIHKEFSHSAGGPKKQSAPKMQKIKDSQHTQYFKLLYFMPIWPKSKQLSIPLCNDCDDNNNDDNNDDIIVKIVFY